MPLVRLGTLIAVLCVSVLPAAAQSPAIPCAVFPPDNVWNTDISALPVHPLSDTYVASIGAALPLHPDFGTVYHHAPNGIPYTVVPATQTLVPVRFPYADESDPGPYPIPANAPIEGGAKSHGDRHVLVVQAGTCILFELFDAHPLRRGRIWRAGSGATWDLNSDALRTAGWTSADAAGLPILPGLVRYDEVTAGAITHAVRVTVSRTQQAFLWPARHEAGASSDPTLPPMGLRLRLRADVDISSFSSMNQVILTGLQHYGMFVADNGSSWYVSGVPDSRWNDDDLHQLDQITGADFEAVDESGLMVDPDSGQIQ
ncbi:MAG TPA: hypothetical protein VN812_10295 [Candidatus Acidoferrales bacterium]|nr:hypothetical protein [Candidatus Acidoferrales bacterium]